METQSTRYKSNLAFTDIFYWPLALLSTYQLKTTGNPSKRKACHKIVGFFIQIKSQPISHESLQVDVDNQLFRWLVHF